MSDVAGQTPDRNARMTYQEAASFLGVGIAYLRNLVHRGHFQAFPVSERYNAPRYLLREEVERYADARDKTPAATARRSAQDTASMLLEFLLWGVSDDGAGGVQMRQRVLEQVARLRRTAEGREALARLAEGLGALLEGDPLLNAPSAAPERERLRQLHDAITGALAEPIKRPSSPRRHAGKPDASGADRLTHAK